MSFADYFTQTQIQLRLCRIRAKRAHNRHPKHFIDNLARPEKGRTEASQDVDALMPPRRSWKRPTKRDRGNRAAPQVNSRSLSLTIAAARNAPGKDSVPMPWLQRLDEFISRIRERMLANDSIKIARPEFQFKRKKPEGYRLLAQYGLEERLVTGLTARYLRDKLDRQLADNSYAFRSSRGSAPPPTHHDAVAELIRYRANAGSDKPLWVAECDIKGFFDVLHHDVVRSAFERACTNAESYEESIDPRARRVFEAMLESYSFAGNGRPALLAKLASDRKSPDSLSWPAADLGTYYDDPTLEPIGIPQGCALSSLIANLVLDPADRAVLDTPVTDNIPLFYARYCDDMIVAHPSKEVVEAAFKRYLAELRKLKLPYHAPQQIKEYGAQYWESKSKFPYRWAPPAEGNVPWVGFLGYQISYDARVRVRESSIEKELEKQSFETNRVIAAIRKESQRSSWRKTFRRRRTVIEYRLRQRLIAMSVGRITPAKKPGDLNSNCWVSGFQLVNDNPDSRRQLRQLDRGRERNLARLRTILNEIDADDPQPDLDQNPEQNEQQRKIEYLRYYGSPFSYFGQFIPRRSVDLTDAQGEGPDFPGGTMPPDKPPTASPIYSSNEPEPQGKKRKKSKTKVRKPPGGTSPLDGPYPWDSEFEPLRQNTRVIVNQ